MVSRIIFLVLVVVVTTAALGRDNGQYKDNELKQWFDSLTSKNGPCCSFADGITVKDVDWDTGGDNKDTQSEGGHYRVFVCANGPGPGETWDTCKQRAWVIVPDNAVISVPNKFGPAVVWPFVPMLGIPVQIRCFMPGTLG